MSQAAARKTIGVVEDNPDNRLLLQAILHELYDIVEYESGADALEGLRRSIPDLVLLDISLPGIDGLTLLDLIRADDRMKDLPVIALTAHAMAGDRARYLEAGFNDYVSKPILDERILMDTIRKWL
jgi:CheY-like chemotaxis protein